MSSGNTPEAYSRPTADRVELLAPAGNFEKLETAIHFGADAVYLAGKDFSLRNFSGNFSPAEMRAAVEQAHARGVRVYVACNSFPRNDELPAVSAYLEQLGDIGPDGVIVADPGIFMEARRRIPQIPLHVSTQANITSYAAARFWEDLGAVRINAARELSLAEIGAITANTALEVEAFVHGAMCMAYSGRCLLSNYMAQRDANRGMCAHPCRWRYFLMEETRPGQFMPVAEDDRGTYVFSARDLCMLEHLPAMIGTGIRALKIEGRMKGIHYVAAVTKTYREALDAYYADPEHFRMAERWRSELAAFGSRGYGTGFYLGPPQHSPAVEAAQSPPTLFVAKVLSAAENGLAFLDVRNKIKVGDPLQVMPRRGACRPARLLRLTDETGRDIPLAQPGSRVSARLAETCSAGDLLRRPLSEPTA